MKQFVQLNFSAIDVCAKGIGSLKLKGTRDLHFYQINQIKRGRILGFRTLITPSKEASKIYQEEIGRLIKKHRSSPQAKLIKDLNPVIRGWTSDYSNSDAQTVGELSKQERLTYLKHRSIF
jgi:RNA-directed DNA polymerase